MNTFERSASALSTLVVMQQVLAIAIQHGVIRATIWIEETETLMDRVELLIAELTQTPASEYLVGQAAGTLLLAARVIEASHRVGVIDMVLWVGRQRLPEYLREEAAKLVPPTEPERKAA